MKKLYAILILFLCILASCGQKETKETYTFYAMDTIISLTFYNVQDSKAIAKDVENIYLEYERVSDDFTAGNQEINVYDLNQKREAEVSIKLKELIEFSLEMQSETNGYFNPFIGRLSHLWKSALEEKKLPEDKQIQEELKIMNETSLEINGNYIKIIGNGNIDLGGVAKGYATSKVEQYLESIHCEQFLLNAGSSNLVLGNKAGKEFVVGLSKASSTGYFKKLHLMGKDISTSSIKEQRVTIDGKTYSHLLNPKTGYPAMYYDTISIIGDDSKILDAYSTACFAMELEEVKRFLDGKNLDYVISKDDELLYQSIGVEAYA